MLSTMALLLYQVTMVVLLSAPRGRISAARMMAAQRDRAEEAYGIIIRPARVTVPAADTDPAPRPRLTVGGEA